MNLMDAICDRRSIRKFLPDPVNELDLKEIVEAGTLAPNAENAQMWKFVAITNKDVIDNIADVVTNKVELLVEACRRVDYDRIDKHKYFLTFFKDAPAIILAFSKPFSNEIDLALDSINMKINTPLQIDTIQQSMGAAIQNMCLVAHSKGYGTTWMYAPVLAYREIGELLEIGAPWVLTALLPIGRPAQSPKARPRKPIEEVFTLIK